MKKNKHYIPLYQLTKAVFADDNTQAGRFEWYLLIAFLLYIILA